MFGTPLILYGVDGNYRDITLQAIVKCHNNGHLHISGIDTIRNKLFGDPIPGVKKNITIVNGGKSKSYPISTPIDLDIELQGTAATAKPNWWYPLLSTKRDDPIKHLAEIQKYLICVGGSIEDESSFILMVIQFINPEAKVLELGGNIGRTSLILATMLIDQKNLVTLEPDSYIFSHLEINKQLNGFIFNVKNAALSQGILLYKSDQTYTPAVVPLGAVEIDTITFDDIQKEYGIEFDTLVVDCRGAFCDILLEDATILDNITTLILKNDYMQISQKEIIDILLGQKGFDRIYCKMGGWGPCREFYYEVWSRGY